MVSEQSKDGIEASRSTLDLQKIKRNFLTLNFEKEKTIPAYEDNEKRVNAIPFPAQYTALTTQNIIDGLSKTKTPGLGKLADNNKKRALVIVVSKPRINLHFTVNPSWKLKT